MLTGGSPLVSEWSCQPPSQQPCLELPLNDLVHLVKYRWFKMQRPKFSVCSSSRGKSCLAGVSDILMSHWLLRCINTQPLWRYGSVRFCQRPPPHLTHRAVFWVLLHPQIPQLRKPKKIEAALCFRPETPRPYRSRRSIGITNQYIVASPRRVLQRFSILGFACATCPSHPPVHPQKGVSM